MNVTYEFTIYQPSLDLKNVKCKRWSLPYKSNKQSAGQKAWCDGWKNKG